MNMDDAAVDKSQALDPSIRDNFQHDFVPIATSRQ